MARPATALALLLLSSRPEASAALGISSAPVLVRKRTRGHARTEQQKTTAERAWCQSGITSVGDLGGCSIRCTLQAPPPTLLLIVDT